MRRSKLTWWDGQIAPRLERADIGVLAALAVLGVATIVTGAAAARHMSPDTATRIAADLREVGGIAVLPNARLEDESGGLTTLAEQARGGLAVVTVVGGLVSRGEFLSRLYAALGDDARVVVVAPGTTQRALVRRSLDDAGHGGVAFYLDATRALMRHVHALPTTFLIDPASRVLERVDGESALHLGRLALRHRLELEEPADE